MSDSRRLGNNLWTLDLLTKTQTGWWDPEVVVTCMVPSKET